MRGETSCSTWSADPGSRVNFRTLMSDRASVRMAGRMYGTAYANQTAFRIVEVQNAQKSFIVTGTGIVADIDTGVRPQPSGAAASIGTGNGYDLRGTRPVVLS